MSVLSNINNSNLFFQSDTAQGLKTIGVAKNQMEIEGKMALLLIESSNVIQQPKNTSSSTLGGTINIIV